MEPHELGLPFQQWQPHQWETISEITAVLAEPDKKYVLLEAPTGTGKSGIALAVGRLLEDAGPSYVLTGTLQLQEQYRRSFRPKMRQARGRGNFKCLIEPHLTADVAPCTAGNKCQYRSQQNPGCDYYDQKYLAMRAPEVTFNYQYYLAQANRAGAFQSSGLLVCDEAHHLDEEVRRFASVYLRQAAFKTARVPWLRSDDLLAWQAHLVQHKQKIIDLYMIASSLQAATPEETTWARSVIGIYEAMLFLTSPGFSEDAWTLHEHKASYSLRPVWVPELANHYLFRHAERVLMMSATILSTELFCAQLGLDPGQVHLIRMPSTFDKRSRPLIYEPVGKVKLSDDDVIDKLIERIDTIADRHPERGIVHTVSYRLQQRILLKSRHRKRMIGHTAETRAWALSQYKKKPNLILLSPSVSTGVDLPYDLCRWQVIAKLAFPDLGDPQTKRRMTRPDGTPNPDGQLWYSWSALCTLIQTYGRGMRAADDSCTTYLLDGNWSWFRRQVRDMIPAWFAEAIIDKSPAAQAVPWDKVFASRIA